jgi:enterochelin esterase-like enzyme
MAKIRLLFSFLISSIFLSGYFLGSLDTAARQPASAFQNGGVIEIGQTVQAELASGAQHTWLFNGQTEQLVTLSAERFPVDPTTTFDPAIDLQAPDGTVLASDDNSGPGADALLLGVELPMDGLYAVVVRSADDVSTGSYQLALAENNLPEGCTSLTGTMVNGEWYSEIARENLRYRVYLPPCYQAGEQRRYPYVLLMHGSNTDDSHWDRLGLDEAVMRGYALGRFPPVALVLPFGGVMANTNVFYIDGSYEYVILNEVIPMVESNYCLQTTPEGKAIGGISRGGFWAYLIGLRHPDLFSAVGGHSPFFDLYHAPDSHNPLALAQSVTWIQGWPRLYMDRGQDDYAQLNIDLMHERLTEREIPHIYELYPVGQHQDSYWSAHVDDYLRFYSAEWAPDTSTYPTCDIPNGGLPVESENNES